MLKGLIFDLDGIITDTAEYHYQAWKELAIDLGISINRDFNENLKGVSRIESLELILEYGNQENEYSEHKKIELATKKNDHYKYLINKITPEDLLPGIKELLDRSRQENMKMAIASASENAPTLLNNLEVIEYFDIVVDPTTLANGKPDPEIFEKATAMLGLKKNEVVGIEDAYFGIKSINKADIFSIGVGDEEILAESDLIVPCTSQLTFDFIKNNFENSKVYR